jgi:hypothetical protein
MTAFLARKRGSAPLAMEASTSENSTQPVVAASLCPGTFKVELQSVGRVPLAVAPAVI